jgi:hypothetical protein
VRADIPGTGISYRQYYGTKRRYRRKGGGLWSLIGVVLIGVLILGLARGVFEALSGLLKGDPWVMLAIILGAIALILVFRRPAPQTESESLLNISPYDDAGARTVRDIQSTQRIYPESWATYPLRAGPHAMPARPPWRVVAILGLIFTTLFSIVMATRHQVHNPSPVGESADGLMYKNERFGFSLRIPAALQAAQAPDNGDGMAFVSADGLTRLTASGSNQERKPLSDLLAEAVAAVPGRTTYKRIGTNWFVISWQDDHSRQIGYRKEFVGQANINEVEITYPIAQRTKYDSALSGMIRSFRPGDLSAAK